MYKVICKFADMQDNNHIYEIGDAYPREGIDVAENRIKELATVNNRIGRVIIEKVPKKPEKVKAEEIIDEPVKIDSGASEKPQKANKE